MASQFSRRDFLPAGLKANQVELVGNTVRIHSRSAKATAACPRCGTASRHVHSRYRRRPADLPAHGRKVELVLLVRRFRCRALRCPAKIFAERFPPDVTRPHARRTSRLQGLVRHLGLALGGRPAQALAARLLLPVSKDTFLRSIRDTAEASSSDLRVIGIDDWAWRKGQRYGTLICDLERRRVIDLLSDREPATVEAWLRARPGIEVVARDRNGGYGGAISRALPKAVQVADRWHLLENASAAFLAAVQRNMPAIRKAIGAKTLDPNILDGLLMNEAGKKIKEQYADTGGFTDLVFAATSLLGYRFHPRIRDLASKRLHVFDLRAVPKELKGLTGDKIREAKIVENWPDILRCIATMLSGRMQPSHLLKKLAARPRQHDLAFALREIGRVERTLFIIEWLLDTDMQRRANIGLNKGEAHHALKGALRIGRQGEIRDRTTEGQHFRIAGLNLLTAIIIYWNSKQLGNAVAKRKRAGLDCPPELLAHISPLGQVGPYHPNRRISLAKNTTSNGLKGFPALSPTRPL